MSYYEYTKTDLLTKEQRMQFRRIDDVVDEADDFLNDIWNTLDHDVTDTLDDDGTEMENFRDDLKTFIFEWVMGEKMNDIKQQQA
jgi:hypothetical protein